jgi:hypothetical protein
MYKLFVGAFLWKAPKKASNLKYLKIVIGTLKFIGNIRAQNEQKSLKLCL